MSSKKIQNRELTVVDACGNDVDIVYINRSPKKGEKPVLCVAHRPEGEASAWVTEDGKLNRNDKEAAIFFEYEEEFPVTEEQVRFPGWRPAKG